MSNEIFIILSENQISIDVFDKEKKKSIHNKIYELKISENLTFQEINIANINNMSYIL